MIRPTLKLNIPPRDLRPKPVQRDLTDEDRRRMLKADLKQVRKRWPGVFDRKNPKPLALGTGKAVRAALGLTHKRSKRLMARLIHCRPYQAALAAKDAQRHDLNGKPVEPVSEEHRANAQTWLDEHPPRGKKAC